MTFPAPAYHPVTSGELAVTVHEKLLPGILEYRFTVTRFPEQIDCESGHVVRLGVGFVKSWMVSLTMHPFEFVTFTEYTPAFPVVYVGPVPMLGSPRVRFDHT
jgi:hypothetical protein